MTLFTLVLLMSLPNLPDALKAILGVCSWQDNEGFFAFLLTDGDLNLVHKLGDEDTADDLDLEFV